jgi:pimeloyl-ACP methyl ester carboxylesterase
MKLKKWGYLLLAFCIFFLVTCQMEFLKFRKNDEKQRAFLDAKGQENVTIDIYEADGARIHFTKTGDESLPLVLMVHGSPGSSSAMLDYLGDTALTRHAQVAAPDRPGFGYSQFGVAEGSLKRQALMLKPLLERAGNRKKILVGHSYGGPVIVRMAMDYPDLVDGLIIVAGSVAPELEPHYWWQHPLNWKLIRWMLPPAFRVSNQEILPLQDELASILPLWPAVRCPVTVIQGTSDNLVDPRNAAFARRLLVNCPNLKINMVGKGSHFIFWTKREIVVMEILAQLGKYSVN